MCACVALHTSLRSAMSGNNVLLRSAMSGTALSHRLDCSIRGHERASTRVCTQQWRRLVRLWAVHAALIGKMGGFLQADTRARARAHMHRCSRSRPHAHMHTRTHGNVQKPTADLSSFGVVMSVDSKKPSRRSLDPSFKSRRCAAVRAGVHACVRACTSVRSSLCMRPSVCPCVRACLCVAVHAYAPVRACACLYVYGMCMRVC